MKGKGMKVRREEWKKEDDKTVKKRGGERTKGIWGARDILNNTTDTLTKDHRHTLKDSELMETLSEFIHTPHLNFQLIIN